MTARTGVPILGLLTLSISAAALAAPPLSGAIFTTTEDGTIVNENVRYDYKEDVYLDGGPGPNAPSSAAGLPEGDYYFQVTDPSGQDLLSTDHISCREFSVSSDGVITSIAVGNDWEKVKGSWTQVSCQHNEGIDADYGSLGAITVQLYPYDDTPNPGGVYKVWITPVDDYTGDPTAGCPTKGSCNINGEGYSAGDFHGFLPAASKTDNYKVKYNGKPYSAPEISIYKFHDADMDGTWDSDESGVTGWTVYVTDPLGTENIELTPSTIVAAVDGDYVFEEDQPAATAQTVAYLDGVIDSQHPTASATVTVNVAGDSGETHEVIYGNVGLGSIDACKVYDRDGDGVADADEPNVPGWEFDLTGTDVLGNAVSASGVADETGCALFSDLAPGDYTVTEATSSDSGWAATGATSQTVTITSELDGSGVYGTDEVLAFTNQYTGSADFGTKGYWHNKNGLDEMTQADIDAANALDPYVSASSYFDEGDEPFDGLFDDGSNVAAANGSAGELLASEGSAKAEVSHFLIDANAGGDRHEQLAQQLLAFFFNTQHALESEDDLIQRPDGTWTSGSAIVDAAIDVYNTGSDSELTDMIGELDDYNNADALSYVPYDPPTPTF